MPAIVLHSVLLLLTAKQGITKPIFKDKDMTKKGSFTTVFEFIWDNPMTSMSLIRQLLPCLLHVIVALHQQLLLA